MSITPALLDIVELLVDVQEQPGESTAETIYLPSGTHGTIVHDHGARCYTLEFVHADNGRTVALGERPWDQFIVVWQAENEQWVPMHDRVAQIMERLPEPQKVERSSPN
jgi:hypothetical protein